MKSIIANAAALGLHKSNTTDTTESIDVEHAMGRHVSFSKVQIRQYERTLGDNPSVSSGPALSLDWTYNTDTEILTIEDYEASRPERKTKVEMVVPRHLREKILKIDCGVSRAEMAACVREIQMVKDNRRQTKNSLLSAKTQEKLENFTRSLGRFLGTRKSDAKEVEVLWQKANAKSTKFNLKKISSHEHSRASVR